MRVFSGSKSSLRSSEALCKQYWDGALIHQLKRVCPNTVYPVDITVDAGEIVSVTINGNVEQLGLGTQSIQRLTGTDGTVEAVVTREDKGYVIVNGQISQCGMLINKAMDICFYNATSDDWPMFMHDRLHTGMNDTSDAAGETLTPVWSAPVSTAQTSRIHWEDHPRGGKANNVFPHPYIDSSPVHASGCPVIVGAYSGTYGSSTGYVVAYDPANHNNGAGILAWRYPSSGTIGGVASTPAVFTSGEEKRVVFGSMDGKVYCLNAVDGAFRWAYQTTNRAGTGNGALLASPTVDTNTGTVYIGNESSRFYALDGNTNDADGSLLWSVDLPVEGSYNDRTGLSSAALAVIDGQKRLYVGSDNGHVYCLSTEQNPPQRIMWDYAGIDGLGLGCVESSPTVYEGNVYVGTSWYDALHPPIQAQFIALDAGTGQLLWQRNLYHEIRATAAAAGGFLFVGEDTGYIFYKLAFDGGEPADLFELTTYNYFVGSAALTSSGLGLVYVGNDNGNFYAFMQSDITAPLATHNAGGIICSSPAVSYAAQDGYRWVYVTTRANGGKLLAFRTQR